MARTIYIEHPTQKVPAVQWKGNNLAELQEFAPGMITIDAGNKVWLNVTFGGQVVSAEVHLNEWLIDDAIIGYITNVPDASFRARFNISTIYREV